MNGLVRTVPPGNGHVTQAQFEALRQYLTTMSVVVARQQLAYAMGYQYGTSRNIYRTLGYPEGDIAATEYYGKYKRHDMAKAVIDRPARATWRGSLELLESDKKETALEKGWVELNERLSLKSVFFRADRLAGIGRYGALLLGLNDVSDEQEFAREVTGGKHQLMYTLPFGEMDVTIAQWEKNPSDERYGLPTIYEIKVGEPGSEATRQIRVHHSRVIHVVDDILTSEVKGIPRLEIVYNRLVDLEKLVGGDAEMFWQGARPGIKGITKEGYKRSKPAEQELLDQFDEYYHNLRRVLLSEGIDFDTFAQQIADPKNHVDIQIRMLSAVTGIPKRILEGSERGELSSTQDQDEWDAYVQTRREEFAEPRVIRPFVERCIQYGVLPKAGKDGYSIQWEDLFTRGEKEKADIARLRSEAIAKYVGTPGAEAVVPPEAFLRYVMELDPKVVDVIIEMLKSYLKEQEQEEEAEREAEKEEIEQQAQQQPPLPEQPTTPQQQPGQLPVAQEFIRTKQH